MKRVTRFELSQLLDTVFQILYLLTELIRHVGGDWYPSSVFEQLHSQCD